MHDHDALDFAELAATLQSAPTPTETAEDIVGYVRAQLDADQAGITVIRRDQLETIAPTDLLVEQLDRLQSDLGEGACYDDAWPSETLTVSNLAEDPRWPTWAAKAIGLGITSLLATELTTVEGPGSAASPPTGPNTDPSPTTTPRSWPSSPATPPLPSREPGTKPDSTPHSTPANSSAKPKASSWNDTTSTSPRAFEVLRRYSQDHNIKLRDVAAHLIETRKLPTNGNTA